MKRSIITLALLAALCVPARAVIVEGRTHIDYYPEGSTSQFCCDGVAVFRLDYNPGQVHFDFYSIVDNTHDPVWTVSDFDVNFSGLSAGGVAISMIEHAGKDYLKLDNFPGFETTINPDMGSGYTEFGPSFIELPQVVSLTTPEPSSILLLAISAACIFVRR